MLCTAQSRLVRRVGALLIVSSKKCGGTAQQGETKAIPPGITEGESTERPEKAKGAIETGELARLGGQNVIVGVSAIVCDTL